MSKPMKSLQRTNPLSSFRKTKPNSFFRRANPLSVFRKLQVFAFSSPALFLRLGAAICFVGHGLLAINGKPGFVGLLGSFGLEPVDALMVLKFIGLVDVLVGLTILIKPNKWVLYWAGLWTTLTVVAWGIHGDSWMDLDRPR